MYDTRLNNYTFTHDVTTSIGNVLQQVRNFDLNKAAQEAVEVLKELGIINARVTFPASISVMQGNISTTFDMAHTLDIIEHKLETDYRYLFDTHDGMKTLWQLHDYFEIIKG